MTTGKSDFLSRSDGFGFVSALKFSFATRAPPLAARIVVAVIAGAFGAHLVQAQYARGPGVHTDFGMLWFGARAMLAGSDPYSMIGPGRVFDYPWTLIYPATALVATIPFAHFTEAIATTLFIGISSFILALGLTRKGWHLLPLFASQAFANSARLGQWSILLTGALFFPWLAVLSATKPQLTIPILAGSTSRRPFYFAVAGGLLLLGISLLLLPGWPTHWIAGVRNAKYMDPPITRLAGPLVVLALFKWRRPEAWLLVTLACMPQSWGWYSALPLFVIPATLLESAVLVTVEGALAFASLSAMPAFDSSGAFYQWVGNLIVLSIYLPATILVLRRPNEGPSPAWLNLIRRADATAGSDLQPTTERRLTASSKSTS